MMAAKRRSFLLLTAAITFLAAPALFASIPRRSEAHFFDGAPQSLDEGDRA